MSNWCGDQRTHILLHSQEGWGVMGRLLRLVKGDGNNAHLLWCVFTDCWLSLFTAPTANEEEQTLMFIYFLKFPSVFMYPWVA